MAEAMQVGAGKRVLVVDDHDPTRQTITRMLEAGGLSELERSIIGRADVPFIKKPFHAESLYSAVREAIAKAEN